MDRALHRTVRSKILGPKRHLVRVPLTRRLNMDHAPVHRTVHGLRLRNFIIVIPHHNACITGVSLGSVARMFRVHSTLRRLTTNLTTRHVARRRVRALREVLMRVNSRVRGGGVRSIITTSMRFRRILCHTSHGRELTSVIRGLQRRACHFHDFSVGRPNHLEGA